MKTSMFAVVIWAKTKKELVANMRPVVAMLAEVGCRISLPKTRVVQDQTRWLGHLLTPRGIGVPEEYVEEIRNWPVPEDSKSLKTFLGFTGFFRSFCQQYAHFSYYLNKGKMKTPFEMTPKMLFEFNKLKEM